MDGTDQPGRRGYHHGNLRAALVAAGLAILEAEGLEALTLRACAARAGVSHAAPKNHFAGLRGLLTAIGAEGFRRHAAAMRAEMPEEGPRGARLLGAMRGYLAFAAAHPALYRLMFSGSRLDFADPELKAAAEESWGILCAICAGLDWRPADGSAPEDARARILVWSFVHGLADLLLNGQLARTREELGGLPDVAALWPAPAYREPEGR